MVHTPQHRRGEASSELGRTRPSRIDSHGFVLVFVAPHLARRFPVRHEVIGAAEGQSARGTHTRRGPVGGGVQRNHVARGVEDRATTRGGTRGNVRQDRGQQREAVRVLPAAIAHGADGDGPRVLAEDVADHHAGVTCARVGVAAHRDRWRESFRYTQETQHCDVGVHVEPDEHGAHGVAVVERHGDVCFCFVFIAKRDGRVVDNAVCRCQEVAVRAHYEPGTGPAKRVCMDRDDGPETFTEPVETGRVVYGMSFLLVPRYGHTHPLIFYTIRVYPTLFSHHVRLLHISYMFVGSGGVVSSRLLWFE